MNCHQKEALENAAVPPLRGREPEGDSHSEVVTDLREKLEEKKRQNEVVELVCTEDVRVRQHYAVV